MLLKRGMSQQLYQPQRGASLQPQLMSGLRPSGGYMLNSALKAQQLSNSSESVLETALMTS